MQVCVHAQVNRGMGREGRGGEGGSDRDTKRMVCFPPFLVGNHGGDGYMIIYWTCVKANCVEGFQRPTSMTLLAHSPSPEANTKAKACFWGHTVLKLPVGFYPGSYQHIRPFLYMYLVCVCGGQWTAWMVSSLLPCELRSSSCQSSSKQFYPLSHLGPLPLCALWHYHILVSLTSVLMFCLWPNR